MQPLFPGSLDVVADIHGEFAAVLALMRHLGYSEDGRHPHGRRLVFLGDLTDRGEDSPAVVSLVANLLAAGRVQCVMGNDELNLLRGLEKHGNAWFFGKTEALDRSGRLIPQVLAGEAGRKRTLDLFPGLPLVLEGDELRVVHACWDPAMVGRVRDETDALQLFQRYEAQIESDLNAQNVTDPVERGWAHQDQSPVKVLTSGHERRAERLFEAAGKLRYVSRVRWGEH